MLMLVFISSKQQLFFSLKFSRNLKNFIFIFPPNMLNELVEGPVQWSISVFKGSTKSFLS